MRRSIFWTSKTLTCGPHHSWTSRQAQGSACKCSCVSGLICVQGPTIDISSHMHADKYCAFVCFQCICHVSQTQGWQRWDVRCSRGSKYLQIGGISFPDGFRMQLVSTEGVESAVVHSQDWPPSVATHVSKVLEIQGCTMDRQRTCSHRLWNARYIQLLL